MGKVKYWNFLSILVDFINSFDWKELRIYVSLQKEKERMNMKTTRKLIQALDYIAYHQHNRTVGFMKAYKLLWLIDRYSMRHYARTVTGDMYFAMEHGTVPTDAKHVLESIYNYG